MKTKTKAGPEDRGRRWARARSAKTFLPTPEPHKEPTTTHPQERDPGPVRRRCEPVDATFARPRPRPRRRCRRALACSSRHPQPMTTSSASRATSRPNFWCSGQGRRGARALGRVSLPRAQPTTATHPSNAHSAIRAR